mmetsp:Transcript_19931/g.54973  ORF Transcript_19931/g.54973 Transcript_19931/m.54973 type:complete len:102 (-) Transcript_19931:29-334(-)
MHASPGTAPADEVLETTPTDCHNDTQRTMSVDLARTSTLRRSLSSLLLSQSLTILPCYYFSMLLFHFLWMPPSQSCTPPTRRHALPFVANIDPNKLSNASF